MHQIKIFAELFYSIERPKLLFKLNNSKVIPESKFFSHENFCEKVVYTIDTDKDYQTNNSLEIELIEKADHLITSDSDHWVSIKDISIDDVHADFSLLQHTTFCHKMPQEWVDKMFQDFGIEILDKYTPGSEIRLNGVCTFTFTTPFVMQRVIDIWKMHTDDI